MKTTTNTAPETRIPRDAEIEELVASLTHEQTLVALEFVSLLKSGKEIPAPEEWDAWTEARLKEIRQ